MTKKISVIFMALFIVFSSVCFADGELGTRWKWVTSTDVMGVYFDTNTIAYTINTDNTMNKNIIDVWTRFKYVDNYTDSKASTFPTIDFKHIKYTVIHHQFNIATKTCRIIQLVFYDTTDDVENVKKISDWVDIIPDTIEEDIFMAVQDYSKGHSQEMLERAK